MIAGIWVRRYVSKVEHFLVAGREMNLYLGIAAFAAATTGMIVGSLIKPRNPDQTAS